MAATDAKYRGKVLIKPALRPGLILWPLFLIIGLGLFGFGTFLWWQAEQQGGFTARSSLGIWLALISMIFAFVAMLYPIRKRTYLLPIGQLEPWCIVHVGTGLISFLFILVHADFGLGAWVSAALMITFGAIVLSGIYGYFIINERNPKVLNRLEIGDDGKQNVRLLEDLVDGIEASEKEMQDVQKSLGEGQKANIARALKIADGLSGRGAHFKKDYNFVALSQNIRTALQNITNNVGNKEAVELERVGITQARINNLKVQFSLQFQLRAWLSFHIVATALMLTLLFAHVLTAIFIY
jgi:hypothetical protein